MINILAEVWIEDFTKFLGVFSTRGLEARRKHGCLRSRVFQTEEDAGHVFLLFEWESKAAFLGFLNDPAVKETMKSSGTTRPPVFTFIEKAAEFEG